MPAHKYRQIYATRFTRQRKQDGKNTNRPCQNGANPDNKVMSNCPETLSVALAHHWLVSMRGGEKVLAALANLFPDAPIYTLIARRNQLDAGLQNRQIQTSWLQRLILIPDLQRKALPFLPSAARSLDVSEYDVVICSDAATIKAVHTRPEALKLCYCHSPMRYVWDMYDQYYAGAGLLSKLGLRLFAKRISKADRTAANGVTAFIANSKHVADRIQRCYDRNSVVIPPPVNTNFPPNNTPPDDYYLVVGEHISYKRNDLAIDACTKMGKSLVVIGTGPLLNNMHRRAGASVRILGWQTDDRIRYHLARCRALLFCGQEDFGMVPVEAQAAGRPVIAYRTGGASETVKEGCTGLFFDKQNIESVIDSIKHFESIDTLWPPSQIQEYAQQFSTDKFIDRFNRFYNWCLAHYRAGGTQQVRKATTTIDREAFL
ncbi:MAG: glycosyltransferase [Planctomycetota bacterium]|nr:MAG: glycosyltransferase [Planctomycetota bacterium]